MNLYGVHFCCCRFLNPQSKEDVINGSMIQITMDETNNQIVMTLKAKIILAYQNITDGLAKQGRICLNGYMSYFEFDVVHLRFLLVIICES